MNWPYLYIGWRPPFFILKKKTKKKNLLSWSHRLLEDVDTIFLKHFGVCYWLAHQTVLSAIDGKGLSIFLCSMSFCMILFVTPAIIPSYPCSSPAPRFLLVFIHFFMDCHRRWCLLWLQDRWRSCYWLDDLFSMLHIGDLIHYPQPYQLSHPLPIKSSFLHAVSCMLMRLGHTVNDQSNAKQLRSMELTINPFISPLLQFPPSFWYLTIGSLVFWIFFLLIFKPYFCNLVFPPVIVAYNIQEICSSVYGGICGILQVLWDSEYLQ